MKISRKTTIEDLAGLVCETLKEHGIDAILTGGAVVSIYSENEYQSYDLDFVTTAQIKKVDEAMKSLGFKKEEGRHYTHPDTPFFVEFPGYAPSIGNEPITTWATKRTRGGKLSLLDPTQCVMDRLAAFFHWNDKQGLDQAVAVAKRHPIQLKKIQNWAREEAVESRFAEFTRALRETQSK